MVAYAQNGRPGPKLPRNCPEIAPKLPKPISGTLERPKMTSRVLLVSNRASRTFSDPVTRSVDALCNVAAHPFSPFRFVFVGCTKPSLGARKIPKRTDVLHWKCRCGMHLSYETKNTGIALCFREHGLFVYKIFG